jgi:hypothetical protein
MDTATRVATRFLLATTDITKEYVEELLHTKGLSPMALSKLKSVAYQLDIGGMDAFPAVELPAFLEERGVDEESIETLKKALTKKPPKPKTGVSFNDAWMQLGRATGKSVIFQGGLEHQKDAAKGVLGWIKALKGLKPKAKSVFDNMVHKIRLRSGRGSEDASWDSGGVLSLVVESGTHSSGTLAFFVTHELGHAVEEHAHVHTHEAPWGAPPFISEYAASKPFVEDFAECFRAYVLEPSALKKASPAKFDAVKALVG